MRIYFFLITAAVFLALQGCGDSGGSTSDTVSSDSSSSAVSSTASSDSPAPTLTDSCYVPEPAPVEARPLLVVRVEYNDHLFYSDAATWSKKIFGNEMHELNHYFESISYGRFSLAPTNEREGTPGDGIITVHLDKDHPDSGFDSSIYPDLKSALVLADPWIDYSEYDTDGNGAITPDEMLIIFIIAGNEDAFSGSNSEDGVWAHQSCVLLSDTAVLDGVRMMGCLDGGNFAIFGERHVDPSINYNEDATIGIIAHELGHAAFNLPDLYDITNRSAGIGYFGLMGAGMWGQQSFTDLYGNTPVPMTAWTKMRVGWVIPHSVEATAFEEVVLHDTASPDYNIAMLPMGDSQCFLLENRAVTGYDTGLNVIYGFYRGGVAIWHVDQSVINSGMLLNVVNADASHKGVDLEEAANAGLDDSFSFPGDAKNLYYYGNETRFDSTTTPDSRRYDGSDSGIAVFDIGSRAPSVSVSITNPNERVSQ